MIVSLFTEFHEHMFVIGLMYARLLPMFFLLPVLNNSVISSTVTRNSIILAIIIGLWPAIDTNIPVTSLSVVDMLFMAAKEAVVGTTIGFTLALPFWIFDALGAYIDTARGASMGSLIDPTSGQESTEASNFINFCVCVVYLESGGFQFILGILVQSYHNVGMMQGFTIDFTESCFFLGKILEQGFIIASPILLILLLTESLLGLLSKFTPQLNAFSISLTIKSVIAFSILSLYFWQMLPDKLSDLMNDYAGMQLLHGIN